MNRILMIIAVLGIMLPVSLVAQGWNAYDDDMEDCKLTEEQRDQLHEIRTEQQKQMIDLQADLEKLEIDQREALRNEDYAAARKLVNKIFQQRGKIALLHIDMMEDIGKILTDEQKALWRHRGMLSGFHHMRPGMHDGQGMGDCGMYQGRGMQPGMHQGTKPGMGQGIQQGPCEGQPCPEPCTGQGQHHRMQQQPEEE